MYRIERRFTLAGGHRLSKHKGRCFSLHGHNYVVLVGIKTPKLDKNDMVIDFSDLKKHVNEIIDPLDHCMLVNACDMQDMKPFIDKNMRVMSMGECDPTAERISEKLYNTLKEKFTILYNYIQMDYVTVYENEDSKATYSED
jgi:6-pyruvoyltetrahydropterin/6-carboxytetrahydropterin synthase